jgi:hypothetical protein
VCLRACRLQPARFGTVNLNWLTFWQNWPSKRLVRTESGQLIALPLLSSGYCRWSTVPSFFGSGNIAWYGLYVRLDHGTSTRTQDGSETLRPHKSLQTPHLFTSIFNVTLQQLIIILLRLNIRVTREPPCRSQSSERRTSSTFKLHQPPLHGLHVSPICQCQGLRLLPPPLPNQAPGLRYGPVKVLQTPSQRHLSSISRVSYASLGIPSMRKRRKRQE